MENKKNIAIIGAGPAGLIAAEVLAEQGFAVTIYDKMPSPARKFLMAGRGGLNLTHSEPLEKFITRYGSAANWLERHIKNFTPNNLVNWCEDLGEKTFIGSSGRVFPESMKAAPLLRAWLKKLNSLGVQFKAKHNFISIEGNFIILQNDAAEIIKIKPQATLFAMGGATWPRLGSNGAWVGIFDKFDIKISPLEPTNCGFKANWSDYFKQKFAGIPLKPIILKHNNNQIQGEVMLTENGLEGGAVYAFSSALREDIKANNFANILLDLKPNSTYEQLLQKLSKPRGKQSLSSFLKKAGFNDVSINLLREVFSKEQIANFTAENFAHNFKNLQIKLYATTGIEKAISSAGGIDISEFDENFMLKKLPSIFCAGEMLNWEAPTGGYLLQACFSTGIAAAKGVVNYISNKQL